MNCPFCMNPDSKVVDSRPIEEGASIRRRRECQSCQKRFTTYETIEQLPLIVIKRDGSREAFDRNKLIAGLLRACDKRRVTLAELETLASDVQSSLDNSLEREVTSEQIGELAMEKLKRIDDVAYVRFASVYRQFKDINTFKSELEKLLREDV